MLSIHDVLENCNTPDKVRRLLGGSNLEVGTFGGRKISNKDYKGKLNISDVIKKLNQLERAHKKIIENMKDTVPDAQVKQKNLMFYQEMLGSVNVLKNKFNSGSAVWKDGGGKIPAIISSIFRDTVGFTQKRLDRMEKKAQNQVDGG